MLNVATLDVREELYFQAYDIYILVEVELAELQSKNLQYKRPSYMLFKQKDTMGMSLVREGNRRKVF